MNDKEHTRLHAIVDGRVQGVGFRYYVIERALPLGITGWVRNTQGGQVEVMAEGSRHNLETLLEALRSGPRAAFITGVQHDWQDATGEFGRFDVRRTE